MLSHVDLQVNPGDFVGIVGPNGSGKTTLLRAVLGLLQPISGIVKVDRTNRFAYVPQVDELNLLWPLTVREMVALAHRSQRAFGRISVEAWAAVDRAIERTGITPLAGRLYAELSGGQRQRTMLAQALSQTPDVLLLDEPTRGLDVGTERDFLDLLAELNRRDALTILLVTHSLSIPINETGKIVMIREGRVLCATPDELVNSDALEKIYGVPFVRGASDGVRWVSARRRP